MCEILCHYQAWLLTVLKMGKCVIHQVKVLVAQSASSVAQSCPTSCDPMDCSTPGFLSITNSRSLLNSCPSSRWCHPAISSSVVPCSSCLKSFPATGSFPMSQFFASGGQSIGVSYYWLVICGLLNHHPLKDNWVLSSLWQWWID